MAFDNNTNVKRVTKIVEFLDLIQNSAEVNNSSPEEVWQMLQPAIERIEQMCGGGASEDIPETPEVDLTNGDDAYEEVETTDAEDDDEDQPKAIQEPLSEGVPTPTWHQVYRFAETAPLEHVSRVSTVFAARIDAAIKALGKAA